MTGLKVLVIDDDPVTLKAVENLLVTQYGFTVDVVESAVEALNKLYTLALEWQPKWYDLILIDINLPVLQGDLLTKIIRETEKEMANVPIVAITSNQTEEQLEQCAKYGISDIIIKPLTKEKMDLVIKKHFPDFATN